MRATISLVVTVQIFAHFVPMQTVRRSLVKVKRPKPINWNSSYYLKPFEACGSLRELNPVEKVKALKYAAEVFARCGYKWIALFAHKLNFVTYGIVRLARYACLIINVSFAAVAGNGGLVVPLGTKSSQILNYLRMGTRSMLITNQSFIIWHGNQKLIIPPTDLHEMTEVALKCVLNTNDLPQLDGDFAKYVADYYRFIM